MTESRKKIETWEAIADHLHVSLRTAQRWRKECRMPVYREAGGHSDRVYAWSDELDRWRYRLDEAPAAPPAAGKKRWLLFGGALLAAGLVAVFLLMAAESAGQLFYTITDYENGSRIEFRDHRDRLVKRLDCPEIQYKSLLSRYKAQGRKILIIQDVDGDGDDDIVFAPREHRNTLFIYFWRGGKSFYQETWHLPLEYSFNNKHYDDFSIGTIELADLDGNPGLEILITQRTHFAPNCLQVFRSDKTPILTLWHPGGLTQCGIIGQPPHLPKRIVVCGTNNYLSRDSSPILFTLSTDWRKDGQRLDFISKDRTLPTSVPGECRIVYVNLQPDDLLPEQAIWEASWIRRLPTGLSPGNMIVSVSHREFFLDQELRCVYANIDPAFKLKHNLDLSQPEIQSLLVPTYWNGSSWQKEMCTIPHERVDRASGSEPDSISR